MTNWLSKYKSISKSWKVNHKLLLYITLNWEVNFSFYHRFSSGEKYFRNGSKSFSYLIVAGIKVYSLKNYFNLLLMRINPLLVVARTNFGQYLSSFLK